MQLRIILWIYINSDIVRKCILYYNIDKEKNLNVSRETFRFFHAEKQIIKYISNRKDYYGKNNCNCKSKRWCW